MVERIHHFFDDFLAGAAGFAIFLSKALADADARHGLLVAAFAAFSFAAKLEFIGFMEFIVNLMMITLREEKISTARQGSVFFLPPHLVSKLLQADPSP